jgi:hypothetical protein
MPKAMFTDLHADLLAAIIERQRTHQWCSKKHLDKKFMPKPVIQQLEELAAGEMLRSDESGTRFQATAKGRETLMSWREQGGRTITPEEEAALESVEEPPAEPTFTPVVPQVAPAMAIAKPKDDDDEEEEDDEVPVAETRRILEVEADENLDRSIPEKEVRSFGGGKGKGGRGRNAER